MAAREAGPGGAILAIEIKSGRQPTALPGLQAFAGAHPGSRPLLVGGDGVPMDEFLERPVTGWF